MTRTGLCAGAALAVLGFGLTLGLGASATAQSVRATPFDKLVVFGDSLSDDGNVAIATGLPSLTGTGIPQKFTTNPGLIGIEVAAADFGLKLAPSLTGGSDFAFGGAGFISNAPLTPIAGTANAVPTVTAQIQGYLAANPKLDPDTLYSVLGGANDIFYHASAAGAGAQAAAIAAQLTAGLPAAQAAAITAAINAQAAATVGVAAVETSTQASTAVVTAAAQEVTLLTAMHAAGARHILVFNLPDIGTTPEGVAAGPASAAGLTALSVAYNQVLNGGLTTIGTGIIPVNLFQLIREVEASPAAFGIVNSTTPACTTSSSLLCTRATLVNPTAPTNYLFADGVHPTSAADAFLGQVVAAELTAPAYISLLSEAPLAVAQGQRAEITDALALDSTNPAHVGTRIFASGGYDARRFAAQSYTPATRDDAAMFTFGFDTLVGADLSVGGAVSYGESLATYGDHAAKFRTQEVLASLFAQYRFLDHAYLNAAAGFGQGELRDIQRSFNIGPSRRLESGSTNDTTLTATSTVGYWFGVGAVKLGPYVAVQYDRVEADGYSESGSDSTAMTFGRQVRAALVAEVGARMQASWRTSFGVVSPYLQASYDDDTQAHADQVSAGLVSMAGSFTMPGYAAAEHWGAVQAGVDAHFADRISVFARYTGRYSDSSQRDQSVNLGVSYAF